jgi:hypothetical protein
MMKMTVRVRLLTIGLVALLGTAVLVPSAALGSGEPEVPFWKIVAKRSESGSSKASIASPAGVKTTVRGKLGASEVEVRCASAALGEGAIEGSQSKHAGRASGVLELAECKLFAKEGEAFKEQAGCEVPSIISGKLAGTLWLEGKKAAGDTGAVIVFEPKELTEGKPLVAKVTINNKEGCAFAGSHELVGDFAMELLPNNEEFSYMQWVLPETAIASVWRPPGEEGEASVGLKLEGNAASLQGEMKAELASKERFGGGIGPVAGIEAPFWGVQRQRLALGESLPLVDPPLKGQVKMSWKLKGTEVDTRCSSLGASELTLSGSLNQHDGGAFAKSIELSECELLAKEGGKFVVQTACEIPPFTFNQLIGRLWLKGTQEARGTTPVLVLEPLGTTTLAKESIKSKTGEKCGFAEPEYAIEGALLFALHPENEETTILGLSITESSAIVWQPAEQQETKQVVVHHGGEPIAISVPEVPFKGVNELEKEGKKETEFGGGPVGVGGEPGPFWHRREVGTKGEGAKIPSKTPETTHGEGGEQRIKGEIAGNKVEITSKKVQLKAQIYNTVLQGQATLEQIYTQPVLTKPELKGCNVALGENNIVVTHGHLMWKWNGERKQLEQAKKTAQKPDLVFTGTEIPEGAAELPKGSLATITLKGSGCGVIAGSFKLEGSEIGLPSLSNVEEWSRTLAVRPLEGEGLQHFWGGRESVGVKTGLLFAGNSANLIGQLEAKADQQEVAIFPN